MRQREARARLVGVAALTLAGACSEVIIRQGPDEAGGAGGEGKVPTTSTSSGGGSSQGGESPGGQGPGGQGPGGQGPGGQAPGGNGEGGAGPLAHNCQEYLERSPGAPSGTYEVAPDGEPITVYCDMTTAGGGWTKVTAAIDSPVVDALRGGSASGSQMIKCSDTGSEHIISPPFSSSWSWGSAVVTKVGGQWIVNGTPVACGTNPEFDNTGCATWWGVGCSNGPGFYEKLYPGIVDTNGFTCAGPGGAHTMSTFVICGATNYASYSIFVRPTPSGG